MIMTTNRVARWAASGLGLSAVLFFVAPVWGALAPPLEWPRVLFRNGVTNTVYQPQLESWDCTTWKATCAVAIQPKGAPQPTFGTIQLTAKTRVDRAQREVVFEELQI